LHQSEVNVTRIGGSVSLQKVVAARDVGDVRGDKERKARNAAVVEKATCLLEDMPSGSFPEVEEAAETARGVASLLKDFDTTAAALRANTAGTSDAADAQKKLDEMRSSFDAMLAPLEATLTAMVRLVEQSITIEAKYKELQTQAQLLDEALKREKERLAAAASAVKNAAKIG
jgi:hypothetical protein